MQARPHGVFRDRAGPGHFAVAEAARLAQEKDVAIEIRQRCQRSRNREAQLLRRRLRALDDRRHAFWTPAPISEVVEGEVARDAEHPHPPHIVVGRRGFGAGHAQEHFLREVARGVGAADHAREVSIHASLVLSKQQVGLEHSSLLPGKDTGGTESCQECASTSRPIDRMSAIALLVRTTPGLTL